jgi:integrase
MERTPAGRRNRRVVKAQTKREVMTKLDQARTELRAGVTGRDVTVGAFLGDWLDTVIAARVGAKTEENYRYVVETHVIPELGALLLKRLNATHIDRLLKTKADAGLSRSVVNRMRMLLKDALNHAERRHLVTRNEASLSVMPKMRRPAERQPFSATEIRALLKAARDDRLGAMVITGLYVALRPGELTGLLWSDIDLDAGILSVSGSMKHLPDGSLIRGPVKTSSAGQRTIALPPPAATALASHRATQAAERLAAGEFWQDHGLVFATNIGTPLDPSNVRRTFTAIARKAGLDRGFPYLMRHTGVSVLLDAGASIEEVADLTGDSPTTLYRHYRHKVRPVATVAAERMASVLA